MRRCEHIKRGLSAEIVKRLNDAGIPFISSDYATMRKGGPTFLILQRPPAMPEYRGVAIMLMHPRRKQTQRQVCWWNRLNDLSLRLAIVFDSEDWNDRFKNWGYLDGQKREGEHAERRQGCERRREEHTELPARLGCYAVEEE
jgi:hypothetical protein